jgi:2,4'-dihydroxyacetophenone dioxygenase
MRPLITGLARPLDAMSVPWIATGPGKAFRPLLFTADGWSELMRLEPGSMVALHRHTGEVHAFNLSGTREIFGTGERAGPGSYVHEPAGTVDEWGAVGDEPCIVHIKVTGAVEYLGADGQVIETVNAETQRAVYLAWCREHGVRPAEQILARPSGADPAALASPPVLTQRKTFPPSGFR